MIDKIMCFFGIHEYEAVDVPPFTTEWKCKRCGNWYAKG